MVDFFHLIVGVPLLLVGLFVFFVALLYTLIGFLSLVPTYGDELAPIFSWGGVSVLLAYYVTGIALALTGLGVLGMI